jgi:2-methylisocitrate lyase-like PEP mutase family enzyme
MRALIDDRKICVSPGVYDGYSVKLAERMGFATASTSGAGIANSRLGKSESLGVMSLMENVDACRAIAAAVDIPVMADADTGYGNAVTVFQTVQYFEAAGVAGLNIEDQSYPKRCGHYAGKELIDAREMAKKIEAAVSARRDPDFIIVARTDAIAVEGIDGALRRAKLYAQAGADLIFPDAVKGEEQIKKFVGEAGAPITINMGFGIRSRATTPLIPVKRLEEIGVARVSLPRMLPAAAIAGMKKALEVMLGSIQSGEAVDRPDLLVGIEEIMALIGDDQVSALEERFLLPEQLQSKYK